MCPGNDESQYCDGSGDCTTFYCTCDVGIQFCSNGINPCDSGNVTVTAYYSINLGAPYCSSIGTSCDTGSLVVGRGAMGDDEPNYPNT